MGKEKLEDAVKNIDFGVALDAALSDLIRNQKTGKTSDDLREILRNMNKNQYFKMFANSYQRKLNKTLDKHYNEMSKEKKVGQKKQKSKGEDNPMYGDIVLDHISGKQVFRQQAPQLFHGQIDSKNKELEDGIKSFSKVPLPPDLRQRKEA